jgi:asparagine synthase (glutamine-hydrolysing)
MCGIAGVFGPFSESDVATKIEKMCREIHHRGPDDRGVTIFPQQAIGMTRLSIIDLSGGHQPIWLDDKIGIVFNGEIYNYKELKQELLKKGAIFKTHSDTEVILHLYYHEGIAGLQKLEGMYGICLLDKRVEKAFIVRDPIGIKPLYYGILDGGFYFSSEIKSIIAGCQQKPRVKMQAVHDYLIYRFVPGPQTIWKDIHKLQPGHIIEYNLSTHKYNITQYWSPNFKSQPIDKTRDYAKEFEQLFLKSVNQQLLASDVPVGAFLSGGLDSSAICAAAVELGHKNFHTYSVAFEGDNKHSELEYARIVSQSIKTDHHEVIVSIDDFKNFMEEQPWYTDEPMADITTVPLYYLSKMAKKDVKAVLSGEGADEFLAGYQYDKFAEVSDMRQKQLSYIPKFVFSILAGLCPTGHKRKELLDALDQYGWGGYIVPYLLKKYPEFNETGKNRLWNGQEFKDSCRINQRMLSEIDSRLPMDLDMSFNARDWLVEDLLMKADKMTMAASLESRVPFLSRELMEWCLRLPVEWKVGLKDTGFTTKRVLREFSAKRLPPEIITREKQGFPIPVYDWLMTDLKSWAEDVLFHQGHLEEWFNMDEVRAVFHKAMQNNVEAQNNVFVLITLSLWKKKWV